MFAFFIRHRERNFSVVCVEITSVQVCLVAGAEQLARAGCVSRDCVGGIQTVNPESDLEMLMARYQQGDFGAATALVHLVSPQLHRFFVALAASRQDADDLLQETWLRVHKVRHTYRPGQPALAWFYGIARHIRIDHYRKAIRARTREQTFEEASHPVSVHSSPSRDLQALLSSLPESQREVLEMLKVSGMSLEEVARATSSTVGSVKQKAHRAYKKLRAALGGEHELREGHPVGLP